MSPIQDLACGARRTLDSIAKKTSPSDVVSLAADRKADAIKAKYAAILQAYADVHVAINHGDNLDETELEKIGQCWFGRPISMLDVFVFIPLTTCLKFKKKKKSSNAHHEISTRIK